MQRLRPEYGGAAGRRRLLGTRAEGENMTQDARDSKGSIGRSIAVPLAIIGMITLVIGGVRMATGEDGTFIVVLAGIFFLVGAFLAIRLVD